MAGPGMWQDTSESKGTLGRGGGCAPVTGKAGFGVQGTSGAVFVRGAKGKHSALQMGAQYDVAVTVD